MDTFYIITIIEIMEKLIFLIDDYNLLPTVTIEVKTEKDYTIYSALNKFLINLDYNVKYGIDYLMKEIYF